MLIYPEGTWIILVSGTEINIKEKKKLIVNIFRNIYIFQTYPIIYKFVQSSPTLSDFMGLAVLE